MTVRDILLAGASTYKWLTTYTESGTYDVLTSGVTTTQTSGLVATSTPTFFDQLTSNGVSSYNTTVLTYTSWLTSSTVNTSYTVEFYTAYPTSWTTTRFTGY